MSEQRGRSHLSACHAVDRVVDEEDGDFFAAVGGVDDFGSADGGEVTVALVGDDDLVGTGALDPGCAGGGAAMGELHIANIEIVVGEDGAADRADEDGFVLQAEVGEGFRDQLVDDAVSTARTVVRLVVQFVLAFVAIVEDG